MDQMSVTQFAGELKMPATVLLEQLRKAGVEKGDAQDMLTEQDKARLLDYLRRSHGEIQPKAKITLTRKQTSEIRATDSTGRARTVQVEVRKKRTFVKRDGLLSDAPQAESGAEGADEELIDEVVASAAVDAVVEAAAVEAVPAVEPAPQPERAKARAGTAKERIQGCRFTALSILRSGSLLLLLVDGLALLA